MIVPAWLLVVLVIGTVARLTRIVTADVIAAPLRRRLRGLLAEWVECPWCVSVWVAFPTAFVAVWWPTNRAIIACMVALTASLITAHIQGREPGDDVVIIREEASDDT